MIYTADGTLQVRSTGRYHGEMRSIITTFRRAALPGLPVLHRLRDARPGHLRRRQRVPRSTAPTRPSQLHDHPVRRRRPRQRPAAHQRRPRLLRHADLRPRRRRQRPRLRAAPPGYARNSGCGCAGTPELPRARSAPASSSCRCRRPTRSCATLTTPGHHRPGLPLHGRAVHPLQRQRQHGRRHAGAATRVTRRAAAQRRHLRRRTTAAARTADAVHRHDLQRRRPAAATSTSAAPPTSSVTIASRARHHRRADARHAGTNVASQFNPRTAGDAARRPQRRQPDRRRRARRARPSRSPARSTSA